MGNKHYHNYSKPYKTPDIQETPVPVDDTPVVETTEPEVEATVVESEAVVDPDFVTEAAPELPTTVTGFVSGCKKLNVRNKPSTGAVILTTINEGTEVTIEQPISDDAFYKVTLANGITGFCMKQFIAVK